MRPQRYRLSESVLPSRRGVGQDARLHARPAPSLPRPPARPGGPRRAGCRARGERPAAVADAREAPGRAGDPRADGVARARRRPAVGRGPDGDRALLSQRQARGQARRRAHAVADGQVGHGGRAVHLRAPGAHHRPGDPSRDARAPAAQGAPGARAHPRAQRDARCARPGRPPAPAAPGRRRLRRRAARLLRRAHRTGRARVPQGQRHGAHLDRVERHVPAPARGRRALPHPPPRPRQARRGRPLAPGAWR